MMTLRPRSRDELLDLMDKLVDELDDAVADLNEVAEHQQPKRGPNETERDDRGV